MEINGSLQIKGTGAFKGAMVKKSSAQAVANNTNVTQIWQTEVYDVGGWFANSGDSEFTIPSGVGYVRLYLQVTLEANATGRREIKFLKNLGSFAGRGLVREPTPDGTVTDIWQVTTAPFPVSEGDIFEAVVFQNSGVELDVSTGDTTWFAIEAVG